MPSDVLVLGAGAAGLHAARVIADLGASVTVLEARDRPGGRMRTEVVAGLGPVELGAEFIHGDAPLSRALKKAIGAKRIKVASKHYEAGPDGPIPARRRWKQLGRVLAQLEGHPDRSVAEALAAVETSDEARRFALAFLTGFDALDPARASVRAVLEQEGGDPGGAAMDSIRVDSGQEALLGPLAAGLTVRTRFVVTHVAHGPDGVVVSGVGPLGHAETLTARRAVVALPLGVLQAGGVTFDPPLAWPLSAVASGGVVRIVLAFGERFWQSKAERLGFIHGRGTFPTFWVDRHRPVITAWCGGPAAWSLSELPVETRVNVALGDLTTALGLALAEVEPQLRGWYTHDWQADAFALGAYSYVTVGGCDALPELARPHGALVLAGEYVPGDGVVSSTVEAALQSGKRAGEWAAGA
jgi:monoamine oxidase